MSTPSKNYFANPLALKNLLGPTAYSDFKRLMDPCCGIGLSKICTDPCGGGGTPSTPLNSIQYNNAGTFGGDSLATRLANGDTEIGLLNGVISSNLSILSTGNTLTWDADTTDTITTKLEQSQNLLGLGASGSALTWQDSSTGVTGVIGTIDGSGLGFSPGSTFISTIKGTSNASIATSYNTLSNTAEIQQAIAEGDKAGNLSLTKDEVKVVYRDDVLGQISSIVAEPTKVRTVYTATGLNTYQTLLGDGTYTIQGNSNDILYLDIANRQSLYGNVSAATGIKVFIDETNGINVQTPGGIANLGANTHGNGTNIQVDDITQLVTITNVPTYADDAAAGVGGLTTGNLYKTTTGGSTFLKIVP